MSALLRRAAPVACTRPWPKPARPSFPPFPNGRAQRQDEGGSTSPARIPSPQAAIECPTGRVPVLRSSPATEGGSVLASPIVFPHSPMAARGARIPHSKGSPCRRPRAAIGRPQDRHPQSNGPRQAINEKPSRSCKRGRRREDSPPKTSIRNHPVKARRRCESSRVPPKTGVVR
jgi:hypothetical protein